MTTALEEGEGSASRPVRSLSQRKTRYPFYRRLLEPQGRSEQDLIPGPTQLVLQSCNVKWTTSIRPFVKADYENNNFSKTKFQIFILVFILFSLFKYRVTIKETDSFNVKQYPNRHRSGHTICVVAQRKDENVFPGILL